MAFWLIDNGPDLGDMGQQAIVDQAATIGIDGARFAEALNSAGVENLVDQDVAEFKRDRFQRVPTVIISGRIIPRIALQGHSVIDRVLDDVQGR
jgi:predicted DsbA family dithiol-disulfide isomerase